MISVYTELLNWDEKAKSFLQKCQVLLLNIQSTQPFCPEEFFSQTITLQTTGHWVSLDAPGGLNKAIENFIHTL